MSRYKARQWSYLCEQSDLVDLCYYGIKYLSFEWAKYYCLQQRTKKLLSWTYWNWLTLYLTGYRAKPRPGCSAPRPILSIVVTAITKPYLHACIGKNKLQKLWSRTSWQNALTFPCKSLLLQWIASFWQSPAGWVQSTAGAGESHAPGGSTVQCHSGGVH